MEIKYKAMVYGGWLYCDMKKDLASTYFSILEKSGAIGTLCHFIGLQDHFDHDLYSDDIVMIRDDCDDWYIRRIIYYDWEDYPAFDLYPLFERDSNCISHALHEPGWKIKRIGNHYDDPKKWDGLIQKFRGRI